jgi:serine/threonine protein kinase/Tol biopolymer transport system component
MSLAVSTRLGRYEIRSLLGAGGMGEVYLTEDTTLRRRAAVKILTSDLTQNEERLHRFVREAYAASSLNHPNIVTIYEIGSEAHIHFIATEYVEGESLREHLRSQQMELREIIDVAIQVTSALAAAHEAGIIHRDIKPENIMLRRDGYVKVLDFGLAKLTDDVDSSQKTDPEAATEVLLKTEPGRIMGTINYMSPEQARGRDVDSRSDIFSLGVMLYEMVAGHRPFSGDTKSDVLAAVLMVEQKPLAEKFPGMPPELNRIVNKALRKDREERYQTAKELLVDLKSLRQDLEFEAKMGREIWRVPRVEQPAPQTDQAAKGSTNGRQAASPRTISELFINEVKVHPRRATITLGVLLIAMIAAGVGVFQLIKSARKPEPFQTMRLTKLTYEGNLAEGQIAISPDGKYVVYVVGEAGLESLLGKHVATSSTVQIVAPAEAKYRGLSFAPDGNYVFYLIRTKTNLNNLYQVPAFGGPSRKLVENAEGPVTFSPDGQRLAFVRDNGTHLMLAKADGSEVRILAKRKEGEAWVMPAWSPDGQIIACGVYSPADSNRRLVQVSVTDGAERPLVSPSWLRLNGVSWLPDGTGLLIAGRDFETRLSQIWFLSFPGGAARRVTNDLSSYFGMGVTADGETVASVQEDRLSNIWVLPDSNSSRARRLTFEDNKDEGLAGLSLTPDGRIVYSARTTAVWDLWIGNQDGNSNQLTFDTRGNHSPSVTPDGRYIVFNSSRTGSENIWRMDLDGSNPKQLTNGPGSKGKPNCSPDGNWVVYENVGENREATLWKVSIDGGTPIQLTETYSEKAAVSPDGKTVACIYYEGRPDVSAKIALIPFEGGPPVKVFDWPAVVRSRTFRWTPDGLGLIYIDSRDRVYNLWTQSLDGSPSKQVTNFSSDQIFGFDISKDGKVVAMARGHEGSDAVLINSFK